MAQLNHPVLRTDRIPISMITADMFIEGNLHSKPGSYLSRVSDILNSTTLTFLPVTEARYRFKSQPDEIHTSDCLVVSIKEIKVVALGKIAIKTSTPNAMKA
jgi:hypothetical protein